MTHSGREVSPARRVVFGLFGIVQVAFAFLAFWDLAHRPAAQVRGPKPVWIPVILINWIGPLAYFYVHRNPELPPTRGSAPQRPHSRLSRL